MDIWNFIRSRRIYVSSIRISFLLLVCVLFIVFLNFSRTSASVTLIYFRALPENGAVYLEWETATEIDSAGFYVTRSASESSGYERIGSFIPSRGDSVAGAYYDFRDSAVENGDTYFYILESWNYDNTVDYTDPVSAIPGTEGSTATPTSTPTKIGSPSPTATQTSGETPTITNTLMVSTKTPTPSNTPEETNTSEPTSTNTPAPIPPTATLTQTDTPTIQGTTPPPTNPAVTVETVQVSPSATLVPLPTIIIVFPIPETIYAPSPSPTPIPTATPEPDMDILQAGFRIIGLTGLVCVVGLVWIMLAIWIYFMIRRLSIQK